MEELRELLNQYVELYGTSDLRTLEISQKLDIPIVEEQRELNNKHHKKYGQATGMNYA